MFSHSRLIKKYPGAGLGAPYASAPGGARLVVRAVTPAETWGARPGVGAAFGGAPPKAAPTPGRAPHVSAGVTARTTRRAPPGAEAYGAPSPAPGYFFMSLECENIFYLAMLLVILFC